MKSYPSRLLACLFLSILCTFTTPAPSQAAEFSKLDKPPLNEQWFGIYVDKDLVGFYTQKIMEMQDGYRIEASGSVRMKVMGFSKEATTREIYLITPGLALKSFEVEHNLNGVLSRASGKKTNSSLRLRIENNGKVSEKSYGKQVGDIYPGPVLNMYPLMRGASAGRIYKLQTFDPEELKVKEIKISVLAYETAPNGVPAVKLRNNLYPFVNNDIWVDSKGNTLRESVRDDLVVTKAEDARSLGAFVSNLAISRKDLIYDFSLVRAEPSIRELSKLKGLAVEISGWNNALPLMLNDTQQSAKSGEGRVTIRTGSAMQAAADSSLRNKVTKEAYLTPSEKIESSDPKIIGKAAEITAGLDKPEDMARALSAWTARWLNDTIDDGGSALHSLSSRHGNCQTHARLYTALARASKIPTRFVSGLVAYEDRGFLYHSWAESWLGDRWVAIDPTYDQVPADPSHLKLFEGSAQEDNAPIIAIIGKIRISVLESRY